MTKKYYLPNDKTYNIVDIHYGTIEDGNIGTCDNCGKVITNIATIKDNDNQTFYVGLDCAKSLSSITQESIDDALRIFKIGQKIRTAILRKIKFSSVGIMTITKGKATNSNIIIFKSTLRDTYQTRISNSQNAQKVILPQLNNLVGYYIKGKKVSKQFYDDLLNLIEVGDKTKGSYKSTVTKIELENNLITLKNDYINSESFRTSNIFNVLEDLLQTEKFINFIDNYESKN